LDNLSLQIDPADVLGVRPDAPLQEIRDAYRAKAKRYHPDAGGEEWAFRILVQAYEVLSTARVARATAREEAAPPRAGYRPQVRPEGPFAPRAEATPPPRGTARPDDSESVRRGVTEPAVDPAQVVDVEKLAIRYQADHIWLISEHSAENRYLSCSLNLTWPAPGVSTPPEEIPGHERTLRGLQATFDAVAAKTSATSSRSVVVDGRFSGWLSYPSNDRLSQAFNQLRSGLHDVGLVVHQWSRDLIVPRPVQRS
jgi:hypothetical protein